MNKAELDKQRSGTLYKGEVLRVRYVGKSCGFHNGKVINAVPRYVHKSGLPYPQPKWIPCEYVIEDEDGDKFIVAKERYGELYKGFEWVVG